MDNKKVKLEKEENDFFRDWIIKEWKHHNTVDEVYQLKIVNSNELKFEENEEYYKIIYDNLMVGFIGLKHYDKEIYLYRFFIDDSYRNLGVGSIVMDILINFCKSINKDLSLDVMGKNKAIHLYERMGFKTHYNRMVLKINENKFIN